MGSMPFRDLHGAPGEMPGLFRKMSKEGEQRLVAERFRRFAGSVDPRRPDGDAIEKPEEVLVMDFDTEVARMDGFRQPQAIGAGRYEDRALADADPGGIDADDVLGRSNKRLKRGELRHGDQP